MGIIETTINKFLPNNKVEIDKFSHNKWEQCMYCGDATKKKIRVNNALKPVCTNCQNKK